jgi:hypothetical protein
LSAGHKRASFRGCCDDIFQLRDTLVIAVCQDDKAKMFSLVLFPRIAAVQMRVYGRAIELVSLHIASSPVLEEAHIPAMDASSCIKKPVRKFEEEPTQVIVSCLVDIPSGGYLVSHNRMMQLGLYKFVVVIPHWQDRDAPC